MLTPWKKSYDQTRQNIKNRDITLPTKVCLIKAMLFYSSHVWMWELDHKENWVPKNWCFWIVLLEKTLESPLDCKEIQPVHPKGNQSQIFIRRTDVITVLWPPDVKDWLFWKDWCWERLKIGEEGDDRGWDGWKASPTQWTWVSYLQELVMDREAWHAAVNGLAKSRKRQRHWTELNMCEGLWRF